jgi:hypothetical protein
VTPHTLLLRCLTLLLALSLAAGAAGARAQDEPASGDAARYFPPIEPFGEGWQVVRSAGLEVDPDVFRTGGVTVLTGPDGARVVAAVLLVTRDRVAVRRSWEAADNLYDNFGGELAYLSGREQELDGDPPPPGCVEAKRIDGTAKQLGIDTGIPLGITMCAAEPDVIVIAVASGAMLDATGYAASDAIVALMVAHASGSATPVAGE